ARAGGLVDPGPDERVVGAPRRVPQDHLRRAARQGGPARAADGRAGVLRTRAGRHAAGQRQPAGADAGLGAHPRGQARAGEARRDGPTAHAREGARGRRRGRAGRSLDPRTARPWGGGGRSKSTTRMRLRVGVLAVAIAPAAVGVLLPGKKQPKAPPEPPPADVTLNVTPETATVLVDGAQSEKHFTHKAGAVSIEVRADGHVTQTLTSLVPGPQTRDVVLQKAAPKAHTVKIFTEPSDAEILEGARRIGYSPALWSEVAAGEHELTLRKPGHHDEKVKVLVTRD